MSFRAVFLGLLLFVVLGGGGLAWSGWNAVSGFVDKVESKRKICSTLDEAERLDLVGVDTPKEQWNLDGSLGRYTCRWATEDFETVPTFVEVVSVPADTWAELTRSELASRVVAGSDLRRVGQLLKAADKPEMTASDGCRVARMLFEFTGAARGADRVVAPAGSNSTGAPSILAQSCVDGTYSAVLVTAPGLKIDHSLARKTARALRAVEERVG